MTEVSGLSEGQTDSMRSVEAYKNFVFCEVSSMKDILEALSLRKIYYTPD